MSGKGDVARMEILVVMEGFEGFEDFVAGGVVLEGVLVKGGGVAMGSCGVRCKLDKDKVARCALLTGRWQLKFTDLMTSVG